MFQINAQKIIKKYYQSHDIQGLSKAKVFSYFYTLNSHPHSPLSYCPTRIIAV